MTPKRLPVTKKALEENAGAAWNAFIELVATTSYEDLTPAQRPAHLVFWYESEVQNGGHLQYFTNRGDERGDETIQSLRALGADAQARVLGQALASWRSAVRPVPADADEYVAIALGGEFDDLDKAFHECPIQLIDALKRYFAHHESDFIARQ